MIPALDDGTLDASGGAITNPSGNFHNGAETGIQRNPTNNALLVATTPSVPSSDIVFFTDPAIANLVKKKYEKHANLDDLKNKYKKRVNVTKKAQYGS